MGESQPLPLGPWAVLLSVVACLVLNGLQWLSRRHLAAESGGRRARLTAEVAYLRREAAKLNTPSTYARCAKYQRLANAKEKELSELGSGSAASDLPKRLALASSVAKTMLLGLASMSLWGRPVAQLSPRAVAAPLGRLLALPGGREFAAYGLVAAAPWLLLVDVATGALVRTAFPPIAVQAHVDAEVLEREAAATSRRPGVAAVAAPSTASS